MKTKIALFTISLILLNNNLVYSQCTCTTSPQSSIREYFLTDSNICLLKEYINCLQSSDGGTIVLKSSIDITETITIPNNITIRFSNGYRLISSNNSKLIFNGGIEAGLFQIFGNNIEVSGKPYTNKIYPEWLGAKVDDQIDDSSAIQKAFNIGNNIVFNSGEYRINKTIYINKPKTSIKGNSDLIGSRTILKHYKSDFSIPNPIFHIKTYQVSINGIMFEGDEKTDNENEIGVLFNREIDNAYGGDIDSEINKCTFFKIAKGVSAYGRNLKLSNNTFSIYQIGIDLNIYPHDNNCNENLGNCKYQGFRGFEVVENRFHAGSIGIRNTGEDAKYLYGCRISNNNYDTHGSLFYGHLSESIISDNLIHRMKAIAENGEYVPSKNSGLCFITAKNLIITDNYLAGEKDVESCTSLSKGGYGIYFGEVVNNCSIKNNIFSNIYISPIYFDNNCNDTEISSNSFRKFTSGTTSFKESHTRGAIEINTKSDTEMSENNIFNNNRMIGCFTATESDNFGRYNNRGIIVKTTINNTSISNNLFRNLRNGIEFTERVSNSKISNNSFSDIEKNAIQLKKSGSNVSISNNNFESYGMNDNSISAIKIDPHPSLWATRFNINSNTFIFSEITDNKAIELNSFINNSKIQNNLFHQLVKYDIVKGKIGEKSDLYNWVVSNKPNSENKLTYDGDGNQEKVIYTENTPQLVVIMSYSNGEQIGIAGVQEFNSDIIKITNGFKVKGNFNIKDVEYRCVIYW